MKYIALILLSCTYIGTYTKVILITGASGDIGFATTKSFLLQGDSVIAQYATNRTDLINLQKDNPEKLKLVQANFNNPHEIGSFWQNCLSSFTQIDIIVNSVGTESSDNSLETIINTLSCNYLSPRLLCDYATAYFKENNISGIIINLGSRAAFRGLPAPYHTYADAKSALTRYTQDKAKELASSNISMYVVAPGPVAGKMFQQLQPDVRKECLDSMPTKKPIEVDEVVNAILFLSSNKVPGGTGGIFDLMGASYFH